MRAGYSVLTQIASLMFAGLVAVLLISFGVVLLTPSPEPARMSIAEAAAAFADPRAPGTGFQVRSVGNLPEGRESQLIAAALADLLGVERDRVRAFWIGDPPGASPEMEEGQTVLIIAGQDAVVESRRGGGFTLVSGEAAALSPQARIPPFTAAVLQQDGHWRIAQPRDPWIAAWRMRMLTALVLSMLLLAPLVWLLAHRLTRPIRRLAEAAERTHLGAEPAVAEEGPTEVRAAAEAMRAMHGRLVAEAAERTRMFAAIAHDLRNPLTGLRVRAEALPGPERQRMVSDLDRMTTMIAQVLDYVRGREIGEQRQPVDLGALVQDCSQEASERGASVSLVAAVDGVIEAELENLRRALLNLVDNALRYAGSARLSVEFGHGSALLIVDDDGPGIPDAQASRLVEPFERLESSRSRETGGTGLGLAIARDVAVRHGGELLLLRRADGGFRAALRIPCSATEKGVLLQARINPAIDPEHGSAGPDR